MKFKGLFDPFLWCSSSFVHLKKVCIKYEVPSPSNKIANERLSEADFSGSHHTGSFYEEGRIETLARDSKYSN